jgi:O-antigen biosynthesis protein WbqP
MDYVLKIFFLIGFILVLPVLFFVSIIVWFEDGRPIIFVQERLGINKKKFNLYKIRTMYKSTPSLGTHQIGSIHHLKSGSFIRKLKIDELPQLINYIKGDINLVGPRPGLPNQIDLKKYREKFNIYDFKPGITGLAQVLGYDMSDPNLLAMIDNLYIKQKSTKLDITIFFATFFSVFNKKLNKRFAQKIEQFKDHIKHV